MRFTVYTDSRVTNTYRQYWKYLWRANSYAYNTNITYEKVRHLRFRFDIKNENFKRRQARGEIFNNPFCLCDYRRETIPGAWIGVGHGPTRQPGENEEYCDGFLLPIQGIPEPSQDWFAQNVFMLDNPSFYDNVVTQSWAKVDISEMQILATLGELPETLRWLASLYLRMDKLLEQFTSRKKALRLLTRKHSKRELTEAFAELWMELRYAIRPLVFDSVSCLKAMQKTIQKGTRMTARAKDTMGTESSTTLSILVSRDNNHTVQYVNERREIITARAGVLYDIDSDICGILAIWGFDQPLESAYELIPGSFILDWFFNIGDVIKSWSIKPGLHPLSSWITVTRELYEVSYGLSFRKPTTWFYNISGPDVTNMGRTTAVLTHKIRIPNPVRQVFPSLNLNLDLSKILDLAIIGKKLYR